MAQKADASAFLTAGLLLPIQGETMPSANVGDVVISGTVEEIELPRVRFTGSTANNRHA